MDVIRFNELNLTDIVSNLINTMLEDDESINIPIPDIFPIDRILLNNFNKRNINSDNINEMLSLCDYLMIKNTQHFIILNMEPGGEYIISDYHATHYNIPRIPFASASNNDICVHGLMKYLVRRGCKKEARLCRIAAQYGPLHILIWLRENACIWTDDVTYVASENGHYDVLK